ncbi:type I-E CRISPR-associated protein Cse2/CasB [Atlantibacter hermannii]|nr:type I-E CRISPR-associated protein Cse2/CasB [Atlantibacter hermannii]NBD01606.1 type I-E CRISPR-associated protein Cse2/CasB [Atlantibacter hermannii]
MLDIDTAKERIIISTEAKNALLTWFESLQQRYRNEGAQRVNGRAWRAELRRCTVPYGALTTDGYFALLSVFSKSMVMRDIDRFSLAMFASVVAHVRAYRGSHSFAAQLGQGEKKGEPCLSRARFERLQAARTPEELCRHLIRAVKLRGDEGVNIISLADGIFLWMREWQARQESEHVEINPFNRNNVRWASEYLLAME